MDFAKGRVREGLGAYQARGQIRSEATSEAAKAAIARDWMAERKKGETVLVLAHTRADVRDLNAAIRTARAQAGELGAEAPFKPGKASGRAAGGYFCAFL
jgi:hypothetical protein